MGQQAYAGLQQLPVEDEYCTEQRGNKHKNSRSQFFVINSDLNLHPVITYGVILCQ